MTYSPKTMWRWLRRTYAATHKTKYVIPPPVPTVTPHMLVPLYTGVSAQLFQALDNEISPRTPPTELDSCIEALKEARRQIEEGLLLRGQRAQLWSHIVKALIMAEAERDASERLSIEKK